MFADEIETGVGNARSMIKEWVGLQKAISEEKKKWATGREFLVDRIELTERSIGALRQNIDDANQNIGKAEKERDRLIEKNEALKNATTALRDRVTDVENRVRDLLLRVPDPVREKVKPFSQRFPEDSKETEMSLSERYQNLVAVLTEINKANREISLTNEVRTAQDGSSVEVTAMYVGIGQGYYVNADETVAGVGTTSDEGWVWSPANDSAAEIARAIKIQRGEEVADYARLPLTVHGVAEKGAGR